MKPCRSPNIEHERALREVRHNGTSACVLSLGGISSGLGVLDDGVFDGELWLESDIRAGPSCFGGDIKRVLGMREGWSEYDRRQPELSGRF